MGSKRIVWNICSMFSLLSCFFILNKPDDFLKANDYFGTFLWPFFIFSSFSRSDTKRGKKQQNLTQLSQIVFSPFFAKKQKIMWQKKTTKKSLPHLLGWPKWIFHDAFSWPQCMLLLVGNSFLTQSMLSEFHEFHEIGPRWIA